MGKVLTEQQIDDYDQYGFIPVVDVMSEEEALGYAARLEQAEAKYPAALNGENRNNAHLAFKFLDELAFHPLLLDAVEDLLGTDILLWGSVLFIKEAQSSHFVSWHQDATYMGVEPHSFVTPWLALSPSNRETGCMTMIPGSHRERIFQHEDSFEKDNILTRGQAIADVDVSSGVDLILKPGQMSMHHAMTVHGSQPNLSQQRRIGYALQAFMPGGAKQVIGENLWLPVRGVCDHPDRVELKRPEADMDPTAIEQRDKANQNWANILYQGAREKRAY
jgi:non-heme Fe2+,alpha-ketoglutarate-dependent halogenase